MLWQGLWSVSPGDTGYSGCGSADFHADAMHLSVDGTSVEAC